MIILIVLLVACFVGSVLATAGMIIANVRNEAQVDIHDSETAALKKVGKWYEQRVAELENENRQLAEQIVTAGGIKHAAMPFWPADDGAEYAYDGTGLVREKLDPRDLPVE